MLRADAVGLALGSLLLVVGLLALVLWGAERRRARTLPPHSRAHGALLGIFAMLYGLRLLIRTATGRLAFDLDPAVLSYAEAAITYVIPLPLFIFCTQPDPRLAPLHLLARRRAGAVRNLWRAVRRDPPSS